MNSDATVIQSCFSTDSTLYLLGGLVEHVFLRTVTTETGGPFVAHWRF